MTCHAAQAELPPVPPSVQEVYCALHEGTPMTGRDLRSATGLPRRTVYAALQRLREIGVLEEQVSLRDARQTFFWIGDHPHAAA